jgi:tRNA nucleotidyltransferase (CCA-adding enzyme)
MADYIYLLTHRLSPAQQHALRMMEGLAREHAVTLFLVGGAVRDLTSGAPVRDLDLVIQGDALGLRKALTAAGVRIVGDDSALHALYLDIPGGDQPGSVRMELGSTLSVAFPKPGKPVYQFAPLLEDLRRRDFTANAMAISLNDGSYGLLMDPLNGVADIENRELRLVSNYGFIEDPVRMIRATRLAARLGWRMEERTQLRYDNGKESEGISLLTDRQRGYEVEEILFEDDPLRVLRRLEAEGWMKALAPAWTSASANAAELDRLHDLQAQLEVHGVHADASTLHLPLLTAKMPPAQLAALKKNFVRTGFLSATEAMEEESKAFAAKLTSKENSAPSSAWKLIVGSRPDVVLATAFGSRQSAVQARFKSFLTEWPQVHQKIPFALLLENRIHPEMPCYDQLIETLFFELMDGRLSAPEEMKAFLEPYSPPAPPPPVNLRRARGGKKDGKASRSRGKKAVERPDVDEDEIDDLAAEAEESDESEDALEDSLEDGLGEAGDQGSGDEEQDETDHAPSPVLEKPLPSAPVAAQPEVVPAISAGVKIKQAKAAALNTSAPSAQEPAKTQKTLSVAAAPVPTVPKSAKKASASAKGTLPPPGAQIADKPSVSGSKPAQASAASRTAKTAVSASDARHAPAAKGAAKTVAAAPKKSVDAKKIIPKQQDAKSNSTHVPAKAAAVKSDSRAKASSAGSSPSGKPPAVKAAPVSARPSKSGGKSSAKTAPKPGAKASLAKSATGKTAASANVASASKQASQSKATAKSVPQPAKSGKSGKAPQPVASAKSAKKVSKPAAPATKLSKTANETGSKAAKSRR